MNLAMDARGQMQYLSFFIAGEEYAIDVLQAKEIKEYNSLTKVPNAPRSVRGVINLRGSVVPVVDLAVKFGFQESAVTKRTCIVIVESVLGGEPIAIGVLVDSVSEVIALQPGEIDPPPPFGTRAPVHYLQGMAKGSNNFVLLLNISQVLSAEEIAADPSADNEKKT